MKLWQLFLSLNLIIVASCQNLPTKNNLSKETAEEILKPYMAEAKKAHQKAMSRRPATVDSVLVYLPENQQTVLPKFDFIFSQSNSLPEIEIEMLRNYISTHRDVLGDKGELQKHIYLKLLSQIKDGDSHIIRFQQSIKRSVGHTYYIDVIGATIVAVIKSGRLTSLNSHLVTVPSLTPVMQNPGMNFQFTDREMSYFFEMIKLHPDKRENLRKYLEVKIANRTQKKISFDSILNKTITEQRNLLNDIFGQLSAKATARMLIDMAQRNQLALVKHGKNWMFQVSHYFFMPMQFDIEIPQNNLQKLTIKNFRQMNTTASVKGFRSPFYPNGNKVENDPATEVAVKKFSEIQDYFLKTMNWSSFDGKVPGADIIVHTNNRTGSLRENAAWIAQDKVFVVGAGGQMLNKIDSSLSVLGHEYMHAILDSTSGLVYRGQSGGLNEHLADIAGASVATDLENKGEFDYTIGSEVISPELRDEKEKLLPNIYSQENFSQKDIDSYNLKKVGLRHFYAPSLSLSEQISDMFRAETAFPSSCQPSVNNDNCGVHTISGVPNKAAALIIAILGFQETKRLFLKTAIYRLNQASNFSDYLIQLHEECMATPSLSGRCEVIIASFAAVGIKFLPNATPVAEPWTPKKPVQVTQIISSNNLASPSVQICGEVQTRNGFIRIDDGVVQPWIITANQEIHTEGDFKGLEMSRCACVRGPLSQIVRSNGKIKSVFLKVDRWTANGATCLSNPNSVWVNKTSDLPDPVPEKFCGWVRVDSQSQNAVVLDNKYNVQVLKNSTQVTPADARAIYTNQCVCVDGKMRSEVDAKNKSYNYFEKISGISIQATENCSGIRWN